MGGHSAGHYCLVSTIRERANGDWH